MIMFSYLLQTLLVQKHSLLYISMLKDLLIGMILLFSLLLSLCFPSSSSLEWFWLLSLGSIYLMSDEQIGKLKYQKILFENLLRILVQNFDQSLLNWRKSRRKMKVLKTNLLPKHKNPITTNFSEKFQILNEKTLQLMIGQWMVSHCQTEEFRISIYDFRNKEDETTLCLATEKF